MYSATARNHFLIVTEHFSGPSVQCGAFEFALPWRIHWIHNHDPMGRSMNEGNQTSQARHLQLCFNQRKYPTFYKRKANPDLQSILIYVCAILPALHPPRHPQEQSIVIPRIEKKKLGLTEVKSQSQPVAEPWV